MRNMQDGIRAIYRQNPQASRRQIMQAIGITKATRSFDERLVRVQWELRGKVPRPHQTFTQGFLRLEEFGDYGVGGIPGNRTGISNGGAAGR